MLVVSCSRDIKTTYRIVGKDGKVMYIDTRGPENVDKTRKNFQNPKEEQLSNKLEIENINKKSTTIRRVKETEISPVTSSAYTLDSVMDRNSMRYNYNTDNSSFKNINSSTKRKSISDFDSMHLPYFNDIIPIESSGTGKSVKVVNKIPSNKTINRTNNASSSNLAETGYYLQIGLFYDRNKALNLKNKFSKIYNFDIAEVENKKGEVLYKVITKVLATESEAKKISEKVKKTGHNDVFIFKK